MTGIQRKLGDERIGRGRGPSREELQLFAGHTAVSTDDGFTKYGFNPDGKGLAAWDMLDRLKNGERLPGIVHDDTGVFSAAQRKGLILVTFAIVLPDQGFQHIRSTLDSERKSSQYYYGFPNGDGDCNCTTWLERLGLPLLTGRMDEFISQSAIMIHPNRRFGWCT